MNTQVLLAATIAIPIPGALLAPVAGFFSSRLRNSIALLSVFAPFVSSALLALALINGAIPASAHLFGLAFKADGLAVFMALMSSFISSVVIVYSFDYISHYRNQNEYYAMAVLFLSAMIGLVYSSNLILLYIFWEITAVTSWRLIGFFRQPSDVVKADKSFLVTVFGALLMLAGFIMLYMQAGSFDLVSIKTAAAAKPVSSLAIALILVGIFSKSATLPFHTWLPDAGVAPSPVTALLHAAVLVKIGVYVFARIFIVTLTLPPQWRTAVLGVAAASAIVSGCAALVDTNLKRIIAYSTVSQIAFIFMGLTAGGEAAVYGALLYILMHGLAKGGLFLCAGIVEQNTHTKDITRLGGLIRTMPVTALSFLLCAFSVMGIPPFGGFFSKYLIFSGAILAGRFRISLLFLAGAFLTMGYLSRAFGRVFLGEPKIEAAEGSQVMVICVAFLAALSLAAGVFIFYLGPPVQTVAWQMMGIAQ